LKVKNEYDITYITKITDAPEYRVGECVYFIYDTYSGFTKIGTTRNSIYSRFITIQKYNPGIILLFTIWMSAAMTFEASLHREFKKKRIFSEWFDLEKKDFDFITEKYKNNITCFKYVI